MSYDWNPQAAPSDFKIGEQVKIHPATDLFMRGEAWAHVERIGKYWIHVRGLRSGQLFKMSPANLAREV